VLVVSISCCCGTRILEVKDCWYNSDNIIGYLRAFKKVSLVKINTGKNSGIKLKVYAESWAQGVKTGLVRLLNKIP